MSAITFLLIGITGCAPAPESPPPALTVDARAVSPAPPTAASAQQITAPVTDAVTAAPLSDGVEKTMGPSEFVRFFASPTTDGWRFPTPYHFHEWRLAAKLTGHPRMLTDAAGFTRKLQVGWAAPRIVILIDDLGNAKGALRSLEALPFVVNGAILPHTVHAAFAAEKIMQAGGDVLLHLPLQPLTFPKDDPGPGALWVTMPVEDRSKVFAGDWESVPRAIGFNNHMGSLFTSDSAAMAHLAMVSRDRVNVFVDSRTIPHSVAAREMLVHRIPALGRTHFLDDRPGDEAVAQRLEEAIRYAKRNGVAVAIGHPNRSTLRILSTAAKRFAAEGVTPVAIHEIFSLK